MGSDAITLNFLKKLDSTDKLIFHVSNLNTRVLDQLASIWRKLWEDSICMRVTPKTNRPSFCLILKLSHALDVCYVGCIVANINALFAKWRITEWDYFQITLLGILSGMDPTIYFQIAIDAVTTTFHVLVNTYFLNFRLALLIVLKILVHLIYLVIFNNFLVFNFPFFNFEQ